MDKYSEFLSNKKFVLESSGFEVDRDVLNKNLFDFQKDIVRWALAKGRAAVFASCGLGSVPYVALRMNRRGLGCELKESYYQ